MDAEGWLHEERKLIEANEWSPPKHRAEKGGLGEDPRLRDLREEVDREAPHRQGRAAAGVHEGQL